MTRPTLLAAFVLGTLLATRLVAQDAAAPAEPAPPAATLPGDLSMGEPSAPADGIGSTYVAATHGDWQQRCVRTADGSDPCQLYQLLKDAEGNSVAEINVFGLPAGSEAVAGATVVVPLGTLLTDGLLLGVDTAEPKRYPFAWCAEIGCISRLGFTKAEVDSLRKGAAATLTIVPVMAPDQKVALKVSLKGFTAGLEAVNAANAKAQEAAAAAAAASGDTGGTAPAEGGN